MPEPMGRIERITLHWTAGGPTQDFDDYHLCVHADGTVKLVRPLDVKGAHTWGRNTGNVGIAMDGHPDKGFPAVQQERTACLAAEVAFRYGLDLDASVDLPRKQNVGGVTLVTVAGTIHAPVLADHAWYAHADGYYPDRWDIGRWFAPIAGKARWYLAALQGGRRKVELLPK